MTGKEFLLFEAGNIEHLIGLFPRPSLPEDPRISGQIGLVCLIEREA